MSGNKVYEYKGYLGSIEVDTENGVLVGRLLFIRDAISYSATDVPSLKTAFEEAVNDYLSSCDATGDSPDMPCKGSFNVRINPQLHREIAIAAMAKQVSLNEFVAGALSSTINATPNFVEHRHSHKVTVSVLNTGLESTYRASSITGETGVIRATSH